MVKLNDPSTFWKGKLGTSANEKMKVGPSFLMPQLRDKDGLIFDKIAKRICIISENEFLKGYIELDKIWMESDDSIITQYRNFKQIVKDENGDIIEEHLPLGERFPKPFCGNRAYLGQIPFYDKINEKKEVLLNPKTKKPIKLIGGIRPPKKNSKGKSYFMKIGICVFHNIEEFGWSEDWLKKEPEKVVADDGSIVSITDPEEEENTEEKFKYNSCSTWVSKKYAEELIKLNGKIIKEYPEIESAFAFIITQKMTPSKDPQYGPSINLNRIILT
jgi:hypothetical protein